MRAESIVERLNQARRALFFQGYASPRLICSDGSIVSLSHGIGEARSDAEKLLGAGSEPLGIVAAPKDCGRPFIQVWQENDAARAALRSMAKSLYRRRFVTTETSL